MESKMPEKRRFRRYNTEVKIYFDFAYDLETKVKFELIDEKERVMKNKYSAVSQNISAEGICFVSHKNVRKDDQLFLECLGGVCQFVRFFVG